MRRISVEHGRKLWVRYRCQKRRVRREDQGRYMVIPGYGNHVCMIRITADGADFKFYTFDKATDDGLLGF